MTLSEAGRRGRALATAIEPFVGSVYFAPEAHQAYAELGFAPSPGRMTEPWDARHWGGVMMTDGVAYFASRASLLGQVPGEVVAAAFGVFCPTAVTAAVTAGAAIADAATVGAARTRAAVAQLVRVLGERPPELGRVIELLRRAGEDLDVAGRPMYAGVLSQGLPDEPLGQAWRLAERLREHRGDCHVAAFSALGYDGCTTQTLHERAAGMPPRTYTLTRGWAEPDLAVADARLRERGLLDGRGAITDAGRAAREEIERATDALWTGPAISLGDDLPELVGLLLPWNAALRAADAYYPSSPQEAVMVDEVQQWMTAHGFAPFPGTGVGA